MILSNRRALKLQIKNRLEGYDIPENADEGIYAFDKFADVITYQGLLRKQKYFEKEQKNLRYAYVICDEAHFFTSDVLDNGINLRGIKNIVVSDMSKSKVLQMIGRARVKDQTDRKNVYIKRFSPDYVEKRINDLQCQKDAYIDRERGGLSFWNKYYNGTEHDWRNAKHWFYLELRNDKGPNGDVKTLRLNEIAKSLLDVRIPQYKYILKEMDNEECAGQKYLEYQLSWFGKVYNLDDDVTYADKDKARKELIAFLESYATTEREIAEKEMESFQVKFMELYDAAFGRADKNKDRIYKQAKMNSLLEERSICYKLEGRAQKGPWKVTKFDWRE